MHRDSVGENHEKRVHSEMEFARGVRFLSVYAQSNGVNKDGTQ